MQEVLKETLPPAIKGRGTSLDPVNRFEQLEIEPDKDWLEAEGGRAVATEYFLDTTRDILAKNDSPDLPFSYSINPYRGCEHGCVYCYARPSHEYFGWSSGLDFETKILVKRDAPRLLRRRLASKNWQPQVVAFSGNTDCYQPAEKQLKLTRRCLEAFWEFRNPVAIITKSSLITRDLDLLRELASRQLVSVTISVTTLDKTLARKMEPRAAAPERRLEALDKLAAAGIPTTVNIAPVIPGLTDHEVPAILAEAARRGVRGAAYILLRLPHSVKELMSNWLGEHYDNRKGKVLNAVRSTRAGSLNDPCFSTRMSGVGSRALAIQKIFDMSCAKHRLNGERPQLRTDAYRRLKPNQFELF